MISVLGRLPDGVSLSPTAQLVFDALARHTVFPWEILSTQCERLELEVTTLRAADLPKLAAPLALALTRFTSVDKGELLKGELTQLSRVPLAT